MSWQAVAAVEGLDAVFDAVFELFCSGVLDSGSIYSAAICSYPWLALIGAVFVRLEEK